MAMGYMAILFGSILVISALLISFLYLSKSDKFKNAIFYLLCVWSILVAFINITSLPSNYIVQKVIGAIFGLLSIIAIFIKVKMPSKVKIAYLIATISTALTLLAIFLFK